MYPCVLVSSIAIEVCSKKMFRLFCGTLCVIDTTITLSTKKAIFALTHFSLKIKRLMLLNVFLLVFLWSSMWTDVGLTFCMPTFSILSPYILLVFFGLIIVILRFKYDFSLLQLRKFTYNLYKGSINFLKWFDTLLRTWRRLTTYEFSFIIFCYITSEKLQSICYQDKSY